MPATIRPRKHECVRDSIRNFVPLKDFQLDPDKKSIRLSAISKIIDFSKSLKKGGSGHGRETAYLEKILKNISYGEKSMPKLYLISNIIGNSNFRPYMVHPLYLISCQKKDSFTSLRMFNHSLLNRTFNRGIFNLCLKAELDGKLINRENMVELLRSMSNKSNFDEDTMSFVEKIFRKSNANGIYWNLYGLNKMMNSGNFSKEIVGKLLRLSNDSFCNLHWCLELANGLISNRRFSKSWASDENISDIYKIFQAITRKVAKSRIFDPFLSLNRFLSKSEDADKRIGAIRKEMEGISSGPELIDFVESLE